MPIRWYGNGDPKDPLYRHFSRIVNLTIHAMLFAALNSGLWLFEQIRHPWPNLKFLTGIWLAFLVLHIAYVVIKRPSPA